MWTLSSGFKKFMRRLFLWLAVIFIVLAVVHVAVDAIFTWQLKSTINKLKTEGKLKPIEEIIPPIPDSENAAPLYNKAFELMTTGEKGKTYIPGSMDWKFNKALDVIDRVLWSETTHWSEEQKHDIPKLIHSPLMQKIYALIEQASRKPKFNFIIDYKKWPDESSCVPERIIHKALQVLFVKELLEEKEGNTNKEINTLLAAFHVLNHFKQNPSHLLQLLYVQDIFLQITTRLNNIVNSSNINPGKLNILLNEISKHSDARPSFIKALDAEALMEVWWLEAYTKDGKFMAASLLVDMIGHRTKMILDMLPGWYTNYLGRLLLKKDKQFRLLMLSEVQERLKTDHEMAYLNLQTNPFKTQIPLCCISMREDSLSYYRAILRQFALQNAAVSLGKIGIALKVYKIKYGSYPDSLNMLTKTTILKEIPLDPFSGKEFAYKKTGNGFILYSFGFNKKDDNGISIQSPWYDDIKGDIVWESEM